MFPEIPWASVKLPTTLNPPRSFRKGALTSRSFLHSRREVIEASYTIKTGDLWLHNQTTDGRYVLWTRPGIVWLEIAFDQLDRAFIAFQEMNNTGASEVWIYWFDPVPSSYVFTKVAEGVIRPVCAMDDRRASQSDRNDIILGYQRKVVEVDPLGNELIISNQVFWRMQRERFLIEHEVPGVPLEYDLYTCGMTKEWRFAFTGTTNLPDTVIVAAGPRQVGVGDDVAVAL